MVWVVGSCLILVYDVHVLILSYGLLFFVHLILCTWACLDRSETGPSNFGIHTIDHISSCSRKWNSLSLSPILYLTSSERVRITSNSAMCSNGCIGATRSRWEESLAVRLVLSIVKSSIILSIVSTSSTRSHSGHMSGIGSIAVFSFNWLHHWIIQVHNQVAVYCVLIGRFGFINRCCSLVVAPGLGSVMICSDSIILRILRNIYILLDCNSRMLDGLVVKWIISVLHILDGRPHEFICKLPSILYLLSVDRRSHI